MFYKIFLLLTFAVCYSLCDSDPCNDYKTCGECIGFPNCVWCATDKLEADKSKCVSFSVANSTADWCNGVIENPKSDDPIIVTDEPFGKVIDGGQVQLRPQYIKIKTRPGIPKPITLSFKPAKDYALDVYFLMDISYTMAFQRDILYQQANEIYKQMTSYTNNVRFGLGSFVEKPGFPYVDKNQNHKSHAFRNHLNLTNNMADFTAKVNQLEFGSNFDDPEAGLDALMQVMSCEKELGWRPAAQRIIVLCTDSTYHSAGDGRVIGVIKPNDMQCHLHDDLYNETMALTYDYPSVSQINTVAEQGHFTIIFAATSEAAIDYTKLAKHILGAQYRSLGDKYDTVNAIKEVYKKMSQSGQLSYDLPQYIQLKTDQDCITKPTKNCGSNSENRIVTITANLTVQYCPPDGQFIQEHEIKIVGNRDKLTIALEIVCQCECEKAAGKRVADCSNNGVLKCGLCECDAGRYGVDCRCTGTSTDDKDKEKCQPPGGGKLCSGRGTCRCGRCETCANGFSGDLCQFSDEACPHKCNGNGNCKHGKCNCNANWAGEDCGCSLNTDVCIAPYSKEICAGNGYCECGRCKCNKLEGKNETYSGRFCDSCLDCVQKRCKELEKYVVCNVNNTKRACDNQYNVTNTIVEFVNKTQLISPEWRTGKMCIAKLDNGSSIIFKYMYQDLDLKLGIQDEAESPAKANVFIAVGSAIGIVLLIGILTLIVWKILVDLHDKREYEKFAKESHAQGFDVSSNPLYNPPQVNFPNPVFQQ